MLKTLSPEQLAVLVLVDLAECSCSEAAELLGIPLGTVKSRLLAARTNMQRARRVPPSRETKEGRAARGA
ncbi:sigma factor-like helix-turn-helix DNA-binding protein [Polyangium jinanense]|uniref:RNA polymerase sigma factor 70 region 4 type 2 domain-containing protein n=1 Tax=Polyangium jinanense TaxID=2829994 RepID=A0A9X4AT70_9BACT|nr:sigma factor-like helix-turn-helix DNA-binding protein [Polyangium jinanense]MDC3955882.1 hypothetical protein [Polyangium jinanense]MDC3983241.1 hypothetical protein [Polyangium jinanense]MDC3985179.1 hypothetical protein [Polyangium jinanense]